MAAPRISKMVNGAVELSAAMGISFAVWYSADFVKWAVGIHSDDDIREMSFYYEDYRWMNEYLDGEHDRVLLFPMSGVSYYLDVPYLRGDPLAAIVDWKRIAAGDSGAVLEVIKREEITHIFIDSGTYRQMGALLDNLAQRGMLEEVKRSDRRLLMQRMTRRYQSTTVILYKVLERRRDGV